MQTSGSNYLLIVEPDQVAATREFLSQYGGGCDYERGKPTAWIPGQLAHQASIITKQLQARLAEKPPTTQERVTKLRNSLDGLKNDSRYWDLCRLYGEFSSEVLSYLERCAAIQARGENHT